MRSRKARLLSVYLLLVVIPVAGIALYRLGSQAQGSRTRSASAGRLQQMLGPVEPAHTEQDGGPIRAASEAPVEVTRDSVAYVRCDRVLDPSHTLALLPASNGAARLRRLRARPFASVLGAVTGLVRAVARESRSRATSRAHCRFPGERPEHAAASRWSRSRRHTRTLQRRDRRSHPSMRRAFVTSSSTLPRCPGKTRSAPSCSAMTRRTRTRNRTRRRAQLEHPPRFFRSRRCTSDAGQISLDGVSKRVYRGAVFSSKF